MIMDKINLVLPIGLFAWLIGIIAGLDQSALIVGAEPSAIEMIMGLIAATVSCHLFLGRSLTR